MREVEEIAKNSNGKVIIYIDKNESDEIGSFLKIRSNFETYVLFRQQVFENRRNKEIYKKEKISTKCNNLYALRFDSGKNQNDRIYCLEFHDGKRRIVLSKLYFGKKSQKINKKLKSGLKPICNREYKFLP